MKSNLLGAACVLLLAACSAQPTHPPAVSPAREVKVPAEHPTRILPAQDPAALFSRELDGMPPLQVVSGVGWSTQVPGRSITAKAGTVENTEEIGFAFEDSAPAECIVFAETFDPASYVGHVIEELDRSLELVGITPTRFAVEQEIPAYFASVFYRKKTSEGVLGGQFKLALGLHRSRPIVCMHDVPGYTASFETAARAVFANYRVSSDVPPIAATISVARVGTMPVGFSHDSVQLLKNGRTEYTSMSAQIVPRSATELMVSDEAEVIIAVGSQLVKGHYVTGDLRGEKMNLVLEHSSSGNYRVSGTLGSKPIEATFDVKHGLPSPEATRQRLRQEVERNRPFHFTQFEYHPALDPTGVIEVSYSSTKDDPIGMMHVGLGQLELLATVDEDGEQIRTELKAGSQSIVFERMYHRDDRKKASGGNVATRARTRRP